MNRHFGNANNEWDLPHAVQIALSAVFAAALSAMAIVFLL